MKRRLDIYERKEEILQYIKENKSKAFICREIKCKPVVLEGFLKEWNIDYKGNKGSKGVPNDNAYIPLNVYLKGDTVKMTTVKTKLIKEGYKENRCEICGLSEWQGKKLPLEVHHKNSNHFDNSIDNLQILCPNCHSIQPGNSGSNIGKYNLEKTKRKPERFEKLKEERLELLQKSNIDFSKFGWVKEVSKLFEISENKAGIYIKNNFPDFYENKCYKRK